MAESDNEDIPVGTLCLFYKQPKCLSPLENAFLATLAVSAEIEIRGELANRALAKREEMLAEVHVWPSTFWTDFHES